MGKTDCEGGLLDWFVLLQSLVQAHCPGAPVLPLKGERLTKRNTIGGFGDRAYIGWIPEGEWSGVSDDDIAKARLVGEDGYEKKHSRTLEPEVPEL